MRKINIQGMNEVVFHEQLENGLNIFVLKKDYNTFSHYFITNYGALIDNFIPINEDKMHKFPKGIAHFLEHKMFEQENGPGVMEKFSSLGGSCNAFTNYDYTAYYVSGVENVKENLEFLIDYVQSPYFTDQNVEKEKEIINQERLMTLDNPYRTFKMRMLDNLFVNYEYGKSIVGTKKDIYSITKEDLYRCYNTFYNPSNMALIIVSNVDEEEIIDFVRENQRKKKFPKQKDIVIEKKEEVEEVNKKYDTFKDNVTKPHIGYAIKFRLDDSKYDIDKMGAYIRILLISNFSKMSNLNLKLKKDKLIHGNIGFGVSKYNDYAIINITVSSDYEDKVIGEIKNNFDNLDLSEELFDLIKKNLISQFVYYFTTTSSIMGYLYDEYYESKTIREDVFIKHKELNYNEYVKYIGMLNFNNVSITVMNPLDKE